MSKLKRPLYPQISLDAAVVHVFRLFRVVGVDSFTRKEAADFLGLNANGPTSSWRIFPALRAFRLIDDEPRGRHLFYRVSETGRTIALHALITDPQLVQEPMTVAGCKYLERRIAERVAEMAADSTPSSGAHAATKEYVDSVALVSHSLPRDHGLQES